MCPCLKIRQLSLLMVFWSFWVSNSHSSDCATLLEKKCISGMLVDRAYDPLLLPDTYHFFGVLVFSFYFQLRHQQPAFSSWLHLFNLEFSLKYQSRDIMDCHCMRFVLSEDLGNVNLRHEFVCIYVCGMWLLVMLMMMLR